MICKNVSLNQKSWLSNGNQAKTLTWRVDFLAFVACCAGHPAYYCKTFWLGSLLLILKQEMSREYDPAPYYKGPVSQGKISISDMAQKFRLGTYAPRYEGLVI